MEKSWIESWDMPELMAVFLNHTYDEDQFGEHEPDADHIMGSPSWSGETSYWEKEEGGWKLTLQDEAAMGREKKINMLYIFQD
jgi:hypothetical protein